MYHDTQVGPSDVEVTSYCLLALNTISRVVEARPLVLWLQRKQNCQGGYRSTQVQSSVSLSSSLVSLSMTFAT